MIQSLKINNFVLIENLTLAFYPGMQVLTGETGAGKSIVVDAVNLVLGGRADRSLIRNGTEKASVEAIFDVPGNGEIMNILNRENIEYDGRTVALYREMTTGGKNLCRVCGVIVSVSVLKEIGTLLMDIHGQHEHQFLMNPDMHLFFLDRMGNDQHRVHLESTMDACRNFLEIHRRYVRMKKEKEQKTLRMEELEKALKTLHAAKLKKGEEEQLLEERSRLRNAERVTEALRAAREQLVYSETGLSSLERIKEASLSIGTLSGLDEQYKNLGEQCESTYYELEEIAFELNRMLDEFDHDPNRLEKVESRLDLIRRLEQKYGNSISEILQEQQRMEQEYMLACSMDDQIAATATEHKKLLSLYREEARKLSESRKLLAKNFENQMKKQLQDLGMEKTVFSVSFLETQPERKSMPRPEGDDRIEFMISTNPGEPPRPLAKIASGGELSRLMLAMKTLEAKENGVDCMVFDEIDTGISGRMAQVVAEKMQMIAENHQVICVSHLPQIAAAANHQFHVSKSVLEGRTITVASDLTREERIVEVARMISGAGGITDDAITYAKSMIEGNEQKRKLARNNAC